MHKKLFVVLAAIIFFIAIGAFYFSKVIGIFGIILAGFGDVLRIIFSNPAGITDVVMRVWSLFLYGFGIKKRHHPWGVVYDAETKQPIHGARLSLLDVDNNTVAECLTDRDGRYGFLVGPGYYHITATKKGFIFPSSKLFGHQSDVVYNDLYFGNYLEIKKYGDVIINNIPMHRLNFKWSEFAEEEKNKFKFYHRGDKAIGQIINVAFIVGFLTSLLTLIGEEIKPYNVIILSLYIIMFFTNRTQFGNRAKGSVFYKDTHLPVAYGLLRVRSSIDNTEIIHQVIDRIGNYYCLLPDGSYMVTIEKKNADGSYTKIHEESSVPVSKGYLNKNFKV